VLTSATTYELTGSIVTYRTNPDDLLTSIGSFQACRLAKRLAVVDNSPAPDTECLCAPAAVDYLFTGRNLGFGTAHNLAIRGFLENTRYHVVLNPDVAFESGTLESIFDFMEANPSVGLARPRVLNPDGSVQHVYKRLPNPADVFVRRFLPHSLEPLVRRSQARFELRDMDHEQTLLVPYLSGCFMFLRASALRQVGLFDPRFFMYFEDTDLTRRIHRFFPTVYYPGASIVHRHGKWSYKNLPLLAHHVLAAVQYFNKWGWFWDAERRTMNDACGPLPQVRCAIKRSEVGKRPI
jgi:GT2 family glycosyltransferase